MIAKPATNLYHKFYHNYVTYAPNKDILASLEEQGKENKEFHRSISENQSQYRYANDKWSIKELIGHLSDAERIFNFRALSFARNEKNALPGFDENDYVKESNFSDRTWQSIIDEHYIVRQETNSLLQNFSENVWERVGDANGSPMVLSAIPYIIYGHEEHHKRIIMERYLK